MDDRELSRTVRESPSRLPSLLSGKDAEETSNLVRRIWKMSETTGRKDLRKAAKKALYLLKSAGFDVDQLRPRRRADATGHQAEVVLTSYLSMPDSYGHNRLIVPVGREDGSSLIAYSFVCHLDRGVLSSAADRTSGKALSRLRDSQEVAPVPPDYALFRLGRARRSTSEAARLSGLPDVLRPSGERNVEHPVLSKTGGSFNRIVNPDRMKEVFQRPEVARLSLPEEDTADLRRQVSEARQSRLVVANMTPRERVRSLMERFAMIYFTPDRRFTYATVLLDIALFDAEANRTDRALPLVDLGASFTRAGTRLMNHPFAQFLLFKTFGGE